MYKEYSDRVPEFLQELDDMEVARNQITIEEEIGVREWYCEECGTTYPMRYQFKEFCEECGRRLLPK